MYWLIQYIQCNPFIDLFGNKADGQFLKHLSQFCIHTAAIQIHSFNSSHASSINPPTALPVTEELLCVIARRGLIVYASWYFGVIVVKKNPS